MKFPALNVDFNSLSCDSLGSRIPPHGSIKMWVPSRVVFVIETSEGDTKSGKSKGRKSPVWFRGKAPVGDW